MIPLIVLISLALIFSFTCGLFVGLQFARRLRQLAESIFGQEDRKKRKGVVRMGVGVDAAGNKLEPATPRRSAVVTPAPPRTPEDSTQAAIRAVHDRIGI